MRSLVRVGLAHLLVTPLPELLTRIVPHLLALRLVDAAGRRWPLGRVLLVLLSRSSARSSVRTSLGAAGVESVASAGDLLRVPTHGLRAVRLLRKEATRRATGACSVEIVRSRRVLGIYWLRQLRLLSWLWCLQGSAPRTRALSTRLVGHQALIVLLFLLSAIADSLTPLRQQVVHLGRAHRRHGSGATTCLLHRRLPLRKAGRGLRLVHAQLLSGLIIGHHVGRRLLRLLLGIGGGGHFAAVVLLPVVLRRLLLVVHVVLLVRCVLRELLVVALLRTHAKMTLLIVSRVRGDFHAVASLLAARRSTCLRCAAGG